MIRFNLILWMNWSHSIGIITVYDYIHSAQRLLFLQWRFILFIGRITEKTTFLLITMISYTFLTSTVISYGKLYYPCCFTHIFTTYINTYICTSLYVYNPTPFILPKWCLFAYLSWTHSSVTAYLQILLMNLIG